MIRVNLIGGLGNQMFQYAFARALSERTKENILINTKCFWLFDIATGRKKRTTISLNNLNIKSDVKITSNKMKGLEYFLRYSYDYFFTRLTLEKFEKRAKKGIFVQTSRSSAEYYPVPRFPSGVEIIGYYANERYFEEVSETIKEELQVITPPSPQNLHMISEISLCNSVCVHIRRGDYLFKSNASLNVADEQYYKRAMKYIYEHTGNPVFYIFSNTFDDIRFIKENYRFEYPVKYIELNNPDYEELRLMYNCKHFILCNSTFSWWGAYLSKNSDKILIAPEKCSTNLYDNAIKL